MGPSFHLLALNFYTNYTLFEKGDVSLDAAVLIHLRITNIFYFTVKKKHKGYQNEGEKKEVLLINYFSMYILTSTLLNLLPFQLYDLCLPLMFGLWKIFRSFLRFCKYFKFKFKEFLTFTGRIKYLRCSFVILTSFFFLEVGMLIEDWSFKDELFLLWLHYYFFFLGLFRIYFT